MVTAIVNINCERHAVDRAGQAIADHPAVTEVYSVTGSIDLVAILRVDSLDDIPDIVTATVGKIPGVLDTETHIAFRTYSRNDADAAFSIGFPAAE